MKRLLVDSANVECSERVMDYLGMLVIAKESTRHTPRKHNKTNNANNATKSNSLSKQDK